MSRLDIIINTPDQARVAYTPKPRKNSGLQKSKKDDDPLKRRIRKKGINFWDLGQIKNEAGSWVDLDWVLSRTIDMGTPVGNGSPFWDHITLAEYNTLIDLIFEIDPDLWTSKYRKLSYESAEKYSLDVVDDVSHFPVARNGSRYNNYSPTIVADSLWTETGLRLPALSGNINFQSYRAFVTLIPNHISVKATILPNYSADSVTFDLDVTKPADVFLVPRITIPTSESYNLPFSIDDLLFQFQLYQRSFWLTHNFTNGYSAWSYDDGVALRMNDADVLILYNSLLSSVQTHWDSEVGFVSVGTFPLHETPILFMEGLGTTAETVYNAGYFIGAIKQNNVTYYFWVDADDTVLVPTPNGMFVTL